MMLINTRHQPRPMCPMADFAAFLAASAEERRGAFLTTAARLGTAEVNVEKDFWVCWTLDALFNGLPSTVLDCCSRAGRRSRKRSD